MKIFKYIPLNKGIRFLSASLKTSRSLDLEELASNFLSTPKHLSCSYHLFWILWTISILFLVSMKKKWNATLELSPFSVIWGAIGARKYSHQLIFKKWTTTNLCARKWIVEYFSLFILKCQRVMETEIYLIFIFKNCAIMLKCAGIIMNL